MTEAKTNDQMYFEMERMVNAATAARRQATEHAFQTKQAQKNILETRIRNLKLFCSVAGRFGIGLVFLGAITREWIVPGFGLAVTAACFVWAWGSFRKGRHR